MHFFSQLVPLALLGLGMVSAKPLPEEERRHPQSTLTVLGIENWPRTETQTETQTINHTATQSVTVVRVQTTTKTLPPVTTTATVDHSTTVDHTKTEKPVTTTTTTQNIYTLYIPPSAAPSPQASSSS